MQPQFSGLIAWRGTLDAKQLPREYTSRRVQLWMGPNAHLVAYPISGARLINVVAVVPGTWNRPGWSAPGEAAEIKNAFASYRWPASARMMLGAVDDWRKWALFTAPEGGQWSEGAVALLGDAVHAMLPFAAQGAGMAIEDAAVLAKVLGEGPGDNAAGIAAALKRYGQMRRARVGRVQRTARRNGTIYHLGGPAAWPATGSSARWGRNACWRGRTGFTIGGREGWKVTCMALSDSRLPRRRPVVVPAHAGIQYAAASRFNH